MSGNPSIILEVEFAFAHSTADKFLQKFVLGLLYFGRKSFKLYVTYT